MMVGGCAIPGEGWPCVSTAWRGSPDPTAEDWGFSCPPPPVLALTPWFEKAQAHTGPVVVAGLPSIPPCPTPTPHQVRLAQQVLGR